MPRLVAPPVPQPGPKIVRLMFPIINLKIPLLDALRVPVGAKVLSAAVVDTSVAFDLLVPDPRTTREMTIPCVIVRVGGDASRAVGMHHVGVLDNAYHVFVGT